MLWKILSCIAAVCLAVGCYFSYINKDALKDERVRETRAVANLDESKKEITSKTDIKGRKTKDLADLEKQRDDTKADVAKANEDITTKTQEVDLSTLQAKHKHRTPAHEVPVDPEQIHIISGTEGVLMTEAGSISAVPVEMRYKATVVRRFWVSNQVPLLHLARIDIPGMDQTLELRDYGANAKPMMLMPSPDEPKIRVEP